MKKLIKKILREQTSTEFMQDINAFHPDVDVMELELEEGKKKKKKKKKKKAKRDACYHKVKSRYKVWPSAYASGALVKCRKVGAKNWGNSTKEGVELNEEMYGMSEPLDYVVVDRRNLRPLMMNYGDGQYYEKWQTKSDAQTSADDLNRAYQKTYGAVEGPHVVMYKSDYFAEKRKEDMMEGKKRKLTKKPGSETSLRDWFKRKGAKGSTGGWVDCNAPDGKGGYKSCGRKSGEKRSKYPACRPTPSACKSKGKGKKWGKKSRSESLNYHLKNQITLNECVFRHGSEGHLNLINAAREYLNENKYVFNNIEKSLLKTDLGKYGLYEGKKVPLDLPLKEAEYRGKKVELNKPKRGGSKKYYVYTKNKKGNVVKVSFGDTTGLKAKINNPGAVKSFVARHKCKETKDRTKASYWSCRLPRYAKALGLSGGGQWW